MKGLIAYLLWLLVYGRASSAVAGAVGEDPPIPEIWNVVKDSFDSDVMVTMPDLDPGAAFLVDERYEITDEKGKLGIIDHGAFFKYNYYSKTDQSFMVQDTKCTVGTLLEHPGYSLYGWYYTSGNGGEANDPPVDNFVFGPSALLKKTEEFRTNIIYVGQDKIRDITSDHWRLPLDDGYIIDYYFSEDNWTMPYGHKLAGTVLKAPVQVTVTGDEGNPWDSKVKKFNQTVYYDYVDFKPFVAPEDFKEFLVESGLDCPKRKTIDPKQTTPPEPVPNIKVFMESITNRSEHYKGILFRGWLHYEQFRQLMRLDIDKDYDVYRQAPLENVQDLGTGIEYSIDKWTGGCSMKRWSKSELGTLVGAEIADIIMADSTSLFKLDNKYIFTGFDETRSLITARWTATRNDISSSTNPGKKHKKVVVDYQFLTKFDDDIGEYTSSPLPVRVDLTIYKDSAVTEIEQVHTLNLLHFQTAFETYELNPFDIRECFDTPFQRSWFKIYFDGGWDKGASQNQDQFKREIIQKISDLTGVSYVRLPEVELDHDELFVYAHVLILDPADYLLQFQDPEKAKPWRYDKQFPMTINDAHGCAAMCLAHHTFGFDCLSFYQCSDEKNLNCYVSNSKDVKVPPTNVTNQCDHYIMTASIDDFQMSNLELFVDLFIRIFFMKQFNFTYTYKDIFGMEVEGHFVGMFLEDEEYPGDPVFLKLVNDDFHRAAKNARLKSSHSHSSIQGSYDDCQLACNLASGFRCESFSYCYNDRSCDLSDYIATLPIDRKEIEVQSDCVVMARDYTADYTVLRGAFYQSDPKKTIKDVLFASTCAYHCDNETSFVCRSFDLCRDSRICSLYVERSIDIPAEKINHSAPLCDHYERNALVDFKIHPNQVLDGNRARYIDDVSTSRCAELCEQEPDYGCEGFDYCHGMPSTCFLVNAHYGDSGVVIHNKPDCDHYSREYFDGQDWNHYSHTKKSKYKYGAGDMAALGVSMLMISIALTLCGVYAYNKRA